jgi:hypothetical protein
MEGWRCIGVERTDAKVVQDLLQEGSVKDVLVQGAILAVAERARSKILDAQRPRIPRKVMQRQYLIQVGQVILPFVVAIVVEEMLERSDETTVIECET